jgi:hypothetical protein
MQKKKSARCFGEMNGSTSTLVAGRSIKDYEGVHLIAV